MSDKYANVVIFAVESTVDLSMSHIYLDKIGYEHIVLGHRDMRSFVSGIQAAVEDPTHIYRCELVPGRFLFASDKVQSKGGKPMTVVVEREYEKGRVITASIRKPGKEHLIYESSGSVYSNYDDRSDILYISKGAARDAYATTSDDERLWFRRAEDDDSPVGITVFGVKEYWLDHLDELVTLASPFLGVVPAEIRNRASVAAN